MLSKKRNSFTSRKLISCCPDRFGCCVIDYVKSGSEFSLKEINLVQKCSILDQKCQFSSNFVSNKKMFNLKPQMIHLILSLRPWHQSEVALPHHHLDHWQALRHSKTIKIINMPNWTWDYWNPELERILNRNDFQLRLIIFVEIHFGLGGLACAIGNDWLENDTLQKCLGQILVVKKLEQIRW